MANKKIFSVQDIDVRYYHHDKGDFLSLNDMVKYSSEGKTIINNWLRNKNTLEYMGIWEKIYNPNFSFSAFDQIMREAGTNRFTMSVVQWVQATGAVGIEAKTGRYGGTYAHKDLAIEFGAWVSPEFKLYLIREFDRLKTIEYELLKESWDLKRELTKVNYRIHTDAIKEMLIPPKVQRTGLDKSVYASEADLLNKALFGKTAVEWRIQNSDKEGNIRDHASSLQLVILSNLESLNAEFIRLGLSAEDRLYRLNEAVRNQMTSLVAKQKSIDRLNG